MSKENGENKLSEGQKRRMLDAIRRAPSYARAYQDLRFLGREELRPVRLQLELLKPEMLLSENNIDSTIVCFGGARIFSPENARERVLALEAQHRARPKDQRIKLKLAAAKRLLARAKYYNEAKEFARLVTKTTQGKGKREFVIVTGGGPGVMEAANRGAHEAGGKSIGLNITLPHEQEPNPFITPELCFQFHYFAIRKMHFLMRCKAMVAFPGGYGTMDELFETLTLVQTGKMRPFPILLFGTEFWKKVINFEYLATEGMIAHEDLKLFRFVDTAKEAWRLIQDYWRQNGLIGS